MNKLKVTTRAMRNQFGKLSGSWMAELGPITAVGTTKDEAVFILGEKLNDWMHYDSYRRFLVASDGTVFSLRHDFGAWVYDIVHTDKPGAYSGGCTILNCKSAVDAYQAMREHWEQYEEQAKLVCAV